MMLELISKFKRLARIFSLVSKSAIIHSGSYLVKNIAILIVLLGDNYFILV